MDLILPCKDQTNKLHLRQDPAMMWFGRFFHFHHPDDSSVSNLNENHFDLKKIRQKMRINVLGLANASVQ